MRYSGKQKSRQRAGKDPLALLVSQVKRFQFKGSQDLLSAHQLLLSIFDECLRLNEQYYLKLSKKNTVSAKDLAEHEAEEQLLIGLANYFYEKIRVFITHEELW